MARIGVNRRGISTCTRPEPDSEGVPFASRRKRYSKRPYELAVWTRLDDESGAAGLAFESNGGDVHYGFYPTGGNLRLTRFEGPSVWNWSIIQTVPSDHYRPGDWNHIKVRVTDEGIQCFVNEQLVIESDDVKLKRGRVGLAKFRHTKAVFRGFQVGAEVVSSSVPEELETGIREQISRLDVGSYPDPKMVDNLKSNSQAARSVLQDRAQELEREAERLRQLADWVHTKRIEEELVSELGKKEADIDLFYCALLLAKNDDPELDMPAYLKMLDAMVDELRKRVPAKADDSKKLSALNEYLFKENGFHGSRFTSNNCYVNRVLDDREGLDITLAVVYLDLARRIGIKGLSGARTRERFMVHYQPAGENGRLIDVYDGGKMLGSGESMILLRMEEHEPETKRQIIGRILRRLMTPVSERGGRPSWHSTANWRWKWNRNWISSAFNGPWRAGNQATWMVPVRTLCGCWNTTRQT